ncbi:hypothetical protein [Pseudothermotoga thermarum]|uniref:Uncharacterized protein n=1 Tax=Pseudothermotoga thermarum DSM 5069 TaxID=688269 RepID=F7YVK2_9THEM|nr:hypothetical protein [Pseudothermotoga thermarum]AEH51657.1 hypothetical protein Theth_1605 [Pseudothermotoga thermarum DSM 5069]
MITNFEKPIMEAMKKRKKIGIQKGVEKGIKTMVIELLEEKFGEILEEYIKN